MVAGVSSFVPPAATPPLLIALWQRATERALPWPLAAGISARRHGVVQAISAPSPPLMLPKALATMLLGSRPSDETGADGGITLAMRRSHSAGVPMWKSAPIGPATS